MGEGGVQEVAQLGRRRGDGGGDEGLGVGERGQYGVSLCRAVADDVRLPRRVQSWIDQEELSGRPVAPEDGGAVPCRCRVAVGGVLVEERSSAAPYGQTGGEMTRRLA
ncbi:hypothetical protein SUDANB135_00304 [Streptomyces sp. SudanB135_2055]|nr:hypothetical protein AUW26_00460 [Streptomyces sp. CC71]GGZ85155.1 hypothetical protein GCM10010301_67760 [Streptomyces plicatus]